MGRRDDEDEGVSFEDCEVKAETAAAVLVFAGDSDFDSSADGRWVPKSVLHDNSEVIKKGDKGQVVLKTWWAEKEGLA